MEPIWTTLAQEWDGWTADGNDPFRLARGDAGNRMDIVCVRSSKGARVGSEGFLLANGMTKEWRRIRNGSAAQNGPALEQKNAPCQYQGAGKFWIGPPERFGWSEQRRGQFKYRTNCILPMREKCVLDEASVFLHVHQ